MTLSGMIISDEEALICDLAETYHIYDYKSLPLSKVAIFSCGLRENSRIKMKMNDIQYPMNTMLLAAIADRLSFLAWSKTVDSQKGRNRPTSIFEMLCGSREEKDIIGFESGEEFLSAWSNIVEGGNV